MNDKPITVIYRFIARELGNYFFDLIFNLIDRIFNFRRCWRSMFEITVADIFKTNGDRDLSLQTITQLK
jgi:hypothetical protein